VTSSASGGQAGWKGARDRANALPEEKKLAVIGGIGAFWREFFEG